MCATLDRTDIKAHTLHWTQLRCNFHEVLFVACARLVSSPKLEIETASQHSAFRSRWANCVAGWKQQHQRFELSCSVATQFWKWPLTSCKSKVKSPKPSNPEPKLHLRAHSLPFSCEQRPSSWKAPCNLNAMNHRVRAATFKENQCFFYVSLHLLFHNSNCIPNLALEPIWRHRLGPLSGRQIKNPWTSNPTALWSVWSGDKSIESTRFNKFKDHHGTPTPQHATKILKTS